LRIVSCSCRPRSTRFRRDWCPGYGMGRAHCLGRYDEAAVITTLFPQRQKFTVLVRSAYVGFLLLLAVDRLPSSAGRRAMTDQRTVRSPESVQACPSDDALKRLHRLSLRNRRVWGREDSERLRVFKSHVGFHPLSEGFLVLLWTFISGDSHGVRLRLTIFIRTTGSEKRGGDHMPGTGFSVFSPLSSMMVRRPGRSGSI
jgi:hypothetical protein